MRLHPRFHPAALVVAVLLGAATPAHAQLTLVEPGFLGTTLSGDLAKQVEIGVGPDTCIYYGSSEGLKKRCAPGDPGTICDSALTFPVGIAFSTGGSFGNNMYVADFGIGNIHRSSGCGVTTLFATIPAPGAIAFPPSGSAYGDYLYACDAFSGPIYRVSSVGVVTSWLDLATAYLRFGPGGAWGTGLYATTYNMSVSFGDSIRKVSSTGVVTPFIGDLFTPEGFDWGFDGDMFATNMSVGEILRVKANGAKSVFATLPGAADVAYRPGEKALYAVSNQGGLYRIVKSSAVDASGGPGASRSLTVAPNPARGACALRFVTEVDGIARVRVLDASGRLVRRLTEAWRPAGAQSIAWDGRDESGAAVRPGNYFASVVAAGGPRQVARVTITH